MTLLPVEKKKIIEKPWKQDKKKYISVIGFFFFLFVRNYMLSEIDFSKSSNLNNY